MIWLAFAKQMTANERSSWAAFFCLQMLFAFAVISDLKPMNGLEPLTCWLQISCSANWATSANVIRRGTHLWEDSLLPTHSLSRSDPHANAPCKEGLACGRIPYCLRIRHCEAILMRMLLVRRDSLVGGFLIAYAFAIAKRSSCECS